MGRLVLTTALLWVFLVPTLCQAGVYDHLCDDCTVESCSHEEDCSDDPCSTILSFLQPVPRVVNITFTVLATPAHPLVSCPTTSADDPPGTTVSRPLLAAFPLHQSDRPLLI